jgi:hypothetical protein
MNNKFKGMLGLLIGMSGFVATPATAGILPVIDSALIAVQQAGNAAIQTGLTTINLTLQQQMTMLRNEQNTASSKVATAVGQASDNMTGRMLDAEKATRGIEAERNSRMPIDPCANAAIGMGDPNYAKIKPGMRSGALQPRYGGSGKGPSTGSARLDTAIAMSDMKIPAVSPEIQAQLAAAGACEAYAANENRVKACQSAFKGVSTGQSRLPNADIRADTLFDGAQLQGNDGLISYQFNDDQISATKAFMRNVTNPVLLRDLSVTELKTDEGRAYLALKDVYTARVDLAEYPMRAWVNNHVKYDKTKAVLQAMLDGDGAAAKYLKKKLAADAPDWNTKGVSLRMMSEIESERRYNNPEWIKEIAQSNDALSLQREQLMISALQADLFSKQLWEQRRANIMLGAIYQAGLNKDYMPELIAQHRKATSSR